MKSSLSQRQLRQKLQSAMKYSMSGVQGGERGQKEADRKGFSLICTFNRKVKQADKYREQ